MALLASVNSKILHESIRKAFQRSVNVSNPEKKFRMGLIDVEGKIGNMNLDQATCENMKRSVIEFEVSKSIFDCKKEMARLVCVLF